MKSLFQLFSIWQVSFTTQFFLHNRYITTTSIWNFLYQISSFPLDGFLSYFFFGNTLLVHAGALVSTSNACPINASMPNSCHPVHSWMQSSCGPRRGGMGLARLPFRVCKCLKPLNMSAVPPAPGPLEWVKHLLDSSQALNFAHFLAVAKQGQEKRKAGPNQQANQPRSWRVSQSASGTCCHSKRAGAKRKPLPEETFFYGILPPTGPLFIL